MKTLLLTTIFLAIAFVASACSGFQKSFCTVVSERIGDRVICGAILAKSSHSVQMSVLDVLSGVENRSTITIWDGTDFDCTGNISMKASDMGNVGDTLITVLPVITNVQENTWDVQGDYRRPYSLFQTAWLNVIKDTVWGCIAGATSNNINNYRFKYPYAGFKTYWQNNGNACVALGVNETPAERVQVIVYNGHITVNSISGDNFLVRVYTVDGRLVTELQAGKQQQLDCSEFLPGIYLLKVATASNRVTVKKIII